MKKFIIYKMSKDAIPAGTGISAGIEFLTTPGRMAQGFRDATKWCDAAILAVRQAGNPNPFKDMTEEEIAGELVQRIESRKSPKAVA